MYRREITATQESYMETDIQGYNLGYLSKTNMETPKNFWQTAGTVLFTGPMRASMPIRGVKHPVKTTLNPKPSIWAQRDSYVLIALQMELIKQVLGTVPTNTRVSGSSVEATKTPTPEPFHS